MNADNDHAGILVEHAFAPYYPQVAPDELRRLGAEIFACSEQRVRAARLDPVLAWDVFQGFLLNSLKHLGRHGGGSVLKLRSWAHTVARNALSHHLKGLAAGKLVSLEELLLGAGADYTLPGPPPVCHDDADLERILLDAIGRLKGRHREFAERHFFCAEDRDEIKASMNLPSDRSFARLQRQTLAALIENVRDVLAITTACVA